MAWLMIPNALARNGSVSPGAKTAYMIVGALMGRDPITIRLIDLAHECGPGVSPNDLPGFLDELQALGYARWAWTTTTPGTVEVAVSMFPDTGDHTRD